MSETETLGNQPQGDDGDAVLSDLDTAIDSTNTDDAEAEESPDPTESEESEEVEGDESDESSEEGDEAEEGETDEAEEEQADTFDELIGRLTLAERKDYAKRYPNAWKRANSPDASDDDRQLLIDKINTDFEYKNLQAQISDEEEPTLEETEEEAEESPAPVDAAEQRKQYYAFVDSVVQSRVDPVAAKELGMNLLQAFMPDVDLSKADDPEVKALVANAGKVGLTLARGAVDLQYSTMQAMLSQQLEQSFPGFADMYARSLYGMTWDRVRSTDPKFAALPNYGTKEYREVMKKAAAEIPNFQNWEFRDKSGRPLPEAKQAEAKLKYLAKIATGQQQPKVTPKAVATALDTGKKLARKADQRRAAGKALGAGQSTRQALGGGKRDYIMDELDMEIKRQSGGARGARK